MQDDLSWEINWPPLLSWTLVLAAFFLLSLASVVLFR